MTKVAPKKAARRKAAPRKRSVQAEIDSMREELAADATLAALAERQARSDALFETFSRDNEVLGDSVVALFSAALTANPPSPIAHTVALAAAIVYAARTVNAHVAAFFDPPSPMASTGEPIRMSAVSDAAGEE